MGKKVFLAVPSHDGKICVPTHLSVFQFLADSMKDGVRIQIEKSPIPYNIEHRVWAGSSIVTVARNILLSMFLVSDCTDLIWIDSDVDWEPGALERLLKHPVDCVAAAYRTKTDDPEKYPVRWLDRPFHPTDKDTGLLEVECAPLGISRMTRACLEKMTNAYPELAYLEDLVPDIKCWALFDNMFVGRDNPDWRARKYWGEDFVFCNRLRAIGGKVWIDPEIATGHTGAKRFPGHYGDALRRNGNDVTDKFMAAHAGLDENTIKAALGEQ